MAQEMNLNQVELINESSSNTNIVCEAGGGFKKFPYKIYIMT